MSKSITFMYKNIREDLNFEGKKTVFDLLSELKAQSKTNFNLGDLSFDFPCGGKKTCGKCRIKIIDGFDFISVPDETEKKYLSYLSEKDIKENIRYACMCEVSGDVTVELNHDFSDFIADKFNKAEIQTEGLKSKNINPDRFRKINIALSQPTLENPISAEENLTGALNNIFPDKKIKNLPFDIIKKLSEKNINGGETHAVLYFSDPESIKIIDVRNPGECEDIYGAAVDIGTTTAAVYLYSLTSGGLIGVAAEENPQRIYGADVITRINYAIENKNNKDNNISENGLNKLKSLILSLVFRLISDLCRENNINPINVYSIVLTGNTVMQHIAAGFSPENIAFTPFVSATLFGFDVIIKELLNGTDINININENAVICFPPAIASYVGGDITTGIIASDTDLCDNLRLFLDIGTNGEIGLGYKNSLVFCATAAGPAFEGAHIKLGMAGVKGAINNIYLDESDNIICETIGNIEPKGICGSGIIDAVAVMLEIGALDETGRVLENGEEDEMPEKYRNLGFGDNLCEIDGENAFVLNAKHNIYITQKDVREIQLAKAAVSAGIMTLLNYGEKNIGDICELILAGGFGSHINKKSACRIGLIPKELEDKIIIAGNTAGMGAASVLLDCSAAERINKISAVSKYIELSGDAFFMDEYIDRMMF
ncbi:MAG: ASKHA domain-containing protein [Oscillospiraceae bacterium]|nr:ASKHA domain-containing protein [Oscillospiraceae bacterium]